MPKPVQQPVEPIPVISKRLIGPINYSRKHLIIFVVLFGLIGAFFIWRALAATTLIASLQAEQMTLPSGAIKINDSNASGGQAVKLPFKSMATGVINLSSQADSVALVAKATRCHRSYPNISISVDGVTLPSINVRSNSWNEYALPYSLAQGAHTVTIDFSHTTRKISCIPTLYLDVARLYGPVAPTPQPTVSLSASPSVVATGGSSTLTWGSTNATSCSASGAWSGTQPTSGTFNTGALSQSSTYNLACSGTGGIASAGVTVTVTQEQPPPPTGSSAPLGVYRGAGNSSGVAAFESWFGKTVPLAEDFLPGDSWSAISSAPDWLFNGWAGKPYQLVLGVPMIPDTGGSLAAGANGDYNSYFKTLAQNLVAKGHGSAILRPGWEFGGGWYKWKVASTTDAANYAAYFRNIVTTMRAQAPSLKFDWNAIWGWQPVDPALAYPGDAYVDYIGIDVYDQSWIPNYTDAVARWNDFMNATWGGQWHKNFANSHGKKMSFPEWGLAIRSDGHGGGDAPYFIQQMHDWFNANNVGYHIYFMYDAPDGQHNLMNGKFPNSADLFKKIFTD
ncbi:hypothetical protein A3A68_00720 [Candidatus Saccharibacteria bacterium RIFCSPLOWO2_01_FULL_48_13]|nr:MAG: hypothetical protein A2884_00065 [Candidatus Saccharibacteria bacterium RIFCSPHIGHO2_01_FULL_48_12]OGL35245.1 MAG: hypothetical protein A3F38_01045 [Candidatus Saccharibacteria bacterium RIFCSPHIGHO2_12_FULL_48_21]OGL37397.1 MAG: hypothetical protein A3A68_00720 [Candidatus Saccharibacteria bacterium RIFCSPLOWO2_01_FULL_48_13]